MPDASAFDSSEFADHSQLLPIGSRDAGVTEGRESEARFRHVGAYHFGPRTNSAGCLGTFPRRSCLAWITSRQIAATHLVHKATSTGFF
jgi:hypothetical protein